MTRPLPWAVVCDFDGTATTEDIGEQVVLRFADEREYDRHEALFAAGAIPFSGLLTRVFEGIEAGPEEVAAFAREVAVFRGGFERFVEACRDGGHPFVVCSAGLDAYIEPVLARLPAPLRGHVGVVANRARFDARRLRVSFDEAAGDCGSCGTCKGNVVRALQRAGHKVLLCGDGTSDRHGAEAADAVFAREGGSLVRWCSERAIPHVVFRTFDEVMARFPAWG
ncbi:MAG TPA: HAD-IB family phosphatase [Anaeromyxobacteraceae bacterium]|nr:HAD-IB family phosphatase [Anaeromyxobacteraceae bacterium]